MDRGIAFEFTLSRKCHGMMVATGPLSFRRLQEMRHVSLGAAKVVQSPSELATDGEVGGGRVYGAGEFHTLEKHLSYHEVDKAFQRPRRLRYNKVWIETQV